MKSRYTNIKSLCYNLKLIQCYMSIIPQFFLKSRKKENKNIREQNIGFSKAVTKWLPFSCFN